MTPGQLTRLAEEKFNGQIVTVSTRPCGKCKGGSIKVSFQTEEEEAGPGSTALICVDSVKAG